MRKLLLAATAAVLLATFAGCAATTDMADVFPTNAAAKQLGPVKASFVSAPGKAGAFQPVKVRGG